MADKKISALTGATTPLAGSEVLPIVQGGSTVKVSVNNLTAGKAVSANSLNVNSPSLVQQLTVTGTLSGNDAADSGMAILRAGTTFGSNLYHTYSTKTFSDAFGITVNDNTTLTDPQYTKYLIGSNGTHIWYGGTTATEFARFDTSGNFKATAGNFVLGTAGKGITTGGATALGLGVNGTVDAVTIDASKNVGIGTTSYVGKLSVSLGNATGFGAPPTWDNTYAVFGGTTANAAAVGIGFNSGIGGSITALSPGLAWHPMSYLAADHRFILAGTEAMRLDSAGNLGVNETAPDYQLDVNGSFGFTPGASVTPVDNGDVVFELTNNTTLTVKAKGSDGVVRSATLTLT